MGQKQVEVSAHTQDDFDERIQALRQDLKKRITLLYGQHSTFSTFKENQVEPDDALYNLTGIVEPYSISTTNQINKSAAGNSKLSWRIRNF